MVAAHLLAVVRAGRLHRHVRNRRKSPRLMPPATETELQIKIRGRPQASREAIGRVHTFVLGNQARDRELISRRANHRRYFTLMIT